MAKSYAAVLASPVGNLGIELSENNLTKIDFLKTNVSLQIPTIPLAKKICRQLNSYFKNPHYQFDLPIKLVGTHLQNQVWRALGEIASGETITYGELAEKLGTSPRAVGNACRSNPIPIIIPCHRVVGKQHLGGYCGKTKGNMTDIKKSLLDYESSLRKPNNAAIGLFTALAR